VRQRQLGLGKEKGISTYYSANCEEEDAKFVQLFMDKIGLSPYNTRLFKNEDGTCHFFFSFVFFFLSSFNDGVCIGIVIQGSASHCQIIGTISSWKNLKKSKF
jgi:hypothetical protein